MAASTQQKANAKRSGAKQASKTPAKRTAKPAAKRGGSKPAAKPKTVKTRSVKIKGANGKTRTVKRPVESTQFGRGGTVRKPEFAAAADKASSLVCTDAKGQPIGRARIGSVQIASVAKLAKRVKLTPAAYLHALVGAKSQKASVQTAYSYADGNLSRTELPDGAGKRIAEASARLGDPKKHKLSGKAFVAALVGLAQSK